MENYRSVSILTKIPNSCECRMYTKMNKYFDLIPSKYQFRF